MTGYPGRVRSMAWSAGGKALATSGADTVIIWPFASKDGPMGKEPAMLAPLKARVTAVACHPDQAIFAAGYEDGTVLMVRMADGAEILVHRNGGAAIAALAWSAKGTLARFRGGRRRSRPFDALADPRAHRSSREQRLAAPVNAHEPSVGESDVVERPKAPERIFPRLSHAGGGTDADRFLARGNDARQRSARAGDAALAGLAFHRDRR